jgi:hypothetical protein
MLENPPIHNNTPSDSNIEYDDSDSSLIWIIDIDNTFKNVNYTDDDLNKLKLLMFNKSTFGKNPYFIIDIKNAIDTDISANYDSDEFIGHEVSIDGSIHVTGTYDNENINSIESNIIHNISGITFRFDNTKKQLIFKFKLKDPTKKDSTFIRSGSINVYLLHNKDLTMFEYYHYLDAYGIYISAD